MLSENIYVLRRKNGLSQEQLAEKIGVSRQSVSKWEIGQSTPELDKLVALCNYFQVTMDQLTTGTLDGTGFAVPSNALPTPTPQQNCRTGGQSEVPALSGTQSEQKHAASDQAVHRLISPVQPENPVASDARHTSSTDMENSIAFDVGQIYNPNIPGQPDSSAISSTRQAFNLDIPAQPDSGAPTGVRQTFNPDIPPQPDSSAASSAWQTFNPDIPAKPDSSAASSAWQTFNPDISASRIAARRPAPGRPSIRTFPPSRIAARRPAPGRPSIRTFPPSRIAVQRPAPGRPSIRISPPSRSPDWLTPIK